jgi:hypothetical protein
MFTTIQHPMTLKKGFSSVKNALVQMEVLICHRAGKKAWEENKACCA